MNTALIVSPSPALLPAPLFAPTPAATKRFIEFFTAQINNDHTRKSYLNATKRFSAWCDTHGLRELVDVEPIHVAAAGVFRSPDHRSTERPARHHQAAGSCQTGQATTATSHSGGWHGLRISCGRRRPGCRHGDRARIAG
jgi:hypothetical protein